MRFPPSRSVSPKVGWPSIFGPGLWEAALRLGKEGEAGVMTIPHSAALKLARSRDHLDALKKEVDAFEQSHPYTFRDEVNPDRTQRTLFLVERRPFPDAVGLMIGDCIHDLRCALDHLVFNLPRGPGTDARWEQWSQFPISNDPEEFLQGKSRDPWSRSGRDRSDRVVPAVCWTERSIRTSTLVSPRVVER